MTPQQLKDSIVATVVRTATIAELLSAYNQVIDFFSVYNAAWNEWAALVTYNTTTNQFAESSDRLWRSLVNGNLNHHPPTNPAITSDAYWTEVSKGTGFTEWIPAIYGNGLIIVYYDASGAGTDPAWYLLKNSTRPYNSTNIITETAAGDWQKFSAGILKKDFAPASGAVSLDMANLREVFFKCTANIGAVNTWAAPSNAGNGLKLYFTIHISAIHDQTFDAIYKPKLGGEGSGDWDTSTNKWTPPATGDYEAEATYNGTNWLLKITGPY